VSSARQPRARAGELCPNGCTEGYGRDRRPVLIRHVVDFETGEPIGDGELSCPYCWDYMGNDLAQMGAL
jgi:hypothetical protein